MVDILIYATCFIGGAIAGFVACSMFTVAEVCDLHAEIDRLLDVNKELKAAKVIKKVVRAKKSG